MAEVSHRLGRLTALRVRNNRPVGAGGASGCLLTSCHRGLCTSSEEEKRREDQTLSRWNTTGQIPKKLWGCRKSEYEQEEEGILLLDPSFDLTSFGLVRCSEPPESPVPLHASGVLLQNKKCLKSLWSRGSMSAPPETFLPPHQLRGFCTVVLILTDQGTSRLRLLKLHPDTFKVSQTRGHSSKSDKVLLHRSRTAYYDILRVSPSATQSQVKTAYYKQSFVYHPDKNPGSKEASQRFSEISEAYTVLGNISLRKKYDRGILSQSDIQSAGRPSSKEPASKPAAPQHQQAQQRARRFSQMGGKPMFDFDAFYRAHYGEQLQRERELRLYKKHMEEMQEKRRRRWRDQKIMEVAVTMILTMAGVIFVSLSRP